MWVAEAQAPKPSSAASRGVFVRNDWKSSLDSTWHADTGRTYPRQWLNPLCHNHSPRKSFSSNSMALGSFQYFLHMASCSLARYNISAYVLIWNHLQIDGMMRIKYQQGI